MNSNHASLLAFAFALAFATVDLSPPNNGATGSHGSNSTVKVLRRRPIDRACNKTNEILRCWSGCEDTCSRQCPLVSASNTSSSVNGTACRKRCVCADGFLRTGNGGCVKMEHCGGAMNDPKLSLVELPRTEDVCPLDLNLTIAKPPALNGEKCRYEYRNDSAGCLRPRIVCPGLDCSQPNEAVQYCGGCFNTCQRTCPVGQIRCPDPICGCAEGFTRISEEAGALCVPVEQCNGTTVEVKI